MSFSVSTAHFIDFVQLVVTGPACLKTFVDLVRTAERESLAWSHKRVLIDMRGIVGRLDDTEQMFLGELVAQHLPHVEKLASVVYGDQIASRSETAARHTGRVLRVFVGKEEAVQWLLASPPAHAAQRAQPSCA